MDSDDQAITSNTALSWRDVAKMVEQSEARLGKRIDDWGQSISDNASQLRIIVSDHERRITAEEIATVKTKASSDTAARFFNFGKWLLATIITCAIAATSIIVAFRP